MAPKKNPQPKSEEPQFKPATVLSTPFALSGSAMGEVRTSTWERGDRGGIYVQIRKVQMKGRDEPAQVTSVTLGNNPDTIDLVAATLKAHAQKLREREAE